MPLQYNTGPSGLMYSPERDFAHQYPRLIRRMRENFEQGLCPELEKIVSVSMGCLDTEEENAICWAELCRANDAYSNFMQICCENPEESAQDCLKRSGFTDLHPAAQFGWLAMMGTVMTGQLFVGLRDVTAHGAGSRPSAEEMDACSDEISDCLNKVEPSD